MERLLTHFEATDLRSAGNVVTPPAPKEGRLLVICGARRLMLHATYDDGYCIPDLLPVVFDLVAMRNNAIMGATKAEVYDKLVACRGLEHLENATSVAALLIAAKPFLLEPVTRGARKDVPSVVDTPYILRIVGHRWRLYGKDKRWLAEYDAAYAVIDFILKNRIGKNPARP